jgi:hypothetical protein
MQQVTLEAIMDIWSRTIGDTPIRQQFEFWALNNSLQVIKEGVVATAKRNLISPMSQTDRVRYCSGVIGIRTAREAAYARNRASRDR